MFILDTSFHHCTRGSGQDSWARKKEIKCIKIVKGEVNISLYVDNLMYAKNSKEFTKKLLELVNGLSKGTGLKSYIKVNFIFIH